jgi:hypothetical protein
MFSAGERTGAFDVINDVVDRFRFGKSYCPIESGPTSEEACEARHPGRDALRSEWWVRW